MSGIIPDSMISIEMAVTESGHPDPYYMVQFPQRVTVTGVSFTVNDAHLGNQGDGHEFTLYCTKGRKARAATEETQWYEDIVPFFGEEKPKVIVDSNKWISNVVAPQESAEWYAANGPNYVADVAQMDPDEYLCIWVEGTDGDFTGYSDDNYTYPETWEADRIKIWDTLRAIVTISYTGATNVD